MRAAGWRVVGSTKAEGWDRPSRPRVDEYPEQRKLRWEREPVTMPTFELEARSGSGRTWRPTSWRQLALLLPGSRYEGQATEWVDQQLEKGAELDFGHMVIRRQGGGHGKG